VLSQRAANYLYRSAIIEKLFMARKTIDEVKPSFEKHDQILRKSSTDIKKKRSGQTKSLKSKFSKVEPALEAKTTLTKNHIRDIVDSICQMKRFTVSWSTLVSAVEPFGSCIKLCLKKSYEARRNERLFKKALI
jgi:hypothetical protein